jgi:TolB-like protein
MVGLLSELQRRRVFRVAIAYLVGAWVLAEVAELAAATFEAPGWVMRMVVTLLVAGLVPAVVLAWMLEVTPDGIRKESSSAGWNSPGPRFWPSASAVGAVVLVGLGLLAVAGLRLTSLGGEPGVAVSPRGETSSLAVLPFLNLSTDPENEYFADGVTQELLVILSRVAGLEVSSRTSSFSFKAVQLPAPEIAARLGVEHVLEGAVRRDGDRVRIDAQLINARRDVQIWSGTYDRELTDIFRVQAEIALAITDALGAVLGVTSGGTGVVAGASGVITVQAPTASLAAYDHYLRGRSALYDRAWARAVEDLSAATRLDPQFAMAWAYLSAAAFGGRESANTETERNASIRLAGEASSRALALDPSLPLPLATRAGLLWEQGRTIEALTAGSRAAALEVEGTTAALWYGIHLVLAGYADEAVPLLEEAVRRDPLVMPNHGWLAAAYLALGDVEAAEAGTRRAAEIAPGAVALRHWRVWLNGVAIELANRGDTARAAALFRETDPPAGALTAAEREGLAGFYAALADPSRRRSFLSGDGADVRPPLRGIVDWDSLALGDAEAFFADIDRMVQEPSLSVLYWLRIGWAPSMTWLREDPRFLTLMRAAGMEDLWRLRGYPWACEVVGGPPPHLSCPAD